MWKLQHLIANIDWYTRLQKWCAGKRGRDPDVTV
ncbi:hypothetical protein EYZ11_010857 [Aspergillus tanneri]|uniref:Uncharacterized protein n=1 Tax=Aspergillus tanneri TaxID=1220188 RepID=A0A4S3J4V6_9EURO|nr:hypothetical protein EYZ11_010857 [Aspergillus tanneri]